jgi:hypothetical protein
MKATIVFGRGLRYPTSIFGSTGLLNHSYVISSNIIPWKKKKTPHQGRNAERNWILLRRIEKRKGHLSVKF